MTAIYQKELRGLFNSLFGWGFVALWLLLGGVFSTVYNLASASTDITYVLQELILFLILLLPFLAARGFTSDNANGASLWLSSLPISRTGIVLGKYLALLTVFAIPTAFLAVYPPLLANFGTVSYGAAYTALAGYFLLGAAWLAVCCFLASRVRRVWLSVLLNLLLGVAVYFLPLLATVFSVLPLIGFLVCLLIAVAVGVVIGIRRKRLLTGLLTGGIPAVLLTVSYFLLPAVFAHWIPQMLNALSLFGRFDGFCSGHLDVPSAAVYLGVTALAVLFAVCYPLERFQKGGEKQ